MFLPGATSDQGPPTYASHIAWITGAHHHSQPCVFSFYKDPSQIGLGPTLVTTFHPLSLKTLPPSTIRF
jgi:hypothetical protein